MANKQPICSWILKVWHTMSPDIITNNLKVAGISNAMDSNEDDCPFEGADKMRPSTSNTIIDGLLTCASASAPCRNREKESGALTRAYIRYYLCIHT